MCECCNYVAAHGGAPGDPALTRKWELIERGRLREAIRGGRWRITFVEPDDGVPAFAYTVGLWSYRHPELVVFGLSPDASGALLNVAGRHVADGGSVVDDDALDLEGWRLKAFELGNPANVVLWAADYYGPAVRAVQLVYPDVHGVWPWEPDCHLAPGQQPMPGQFDARA
jgi:hypothetical protein